MASEGVAATRLKIACLNSADDEETLPKKLDITLVCAEVMKKNS